MNNNELGQELFSVLTDYKDVYHGDVLKAVEDILYDNDIDAFFKTDTHGPVTVVIGEFDNGSPIDIRVVFEDDWETLYSVEAFGSELNEEFKKAYKSL